MVRDLFSLFSVQDPNSKDQSPVSFSVREVTDELTLFPSPCHFSSSAFLFICVENTKPQALHGFLIHFSIITWFLFRDFLLLTLYTLEDNVSVSVRFFFLLLILSSPFKLLLPAKVDGYDCSLKSLKMLLLSTIFHFWWLGFVVLGSGLVIRFWFCLGVGSRDLGVFGHVLNHIRFGYFPRMDGELGTHYPVQPKFMVVVQDHDELGAEKG